MPKNRIITLADFRRTTISRVRGVFTKTNYSLGDDWLHALYNEALAEIQRRCMIWRKQHTFSLVAGTYYYALPDDLLDDMIDPETVQLAEASATEWSRPEFKSWGDMVELYQDFSNPEAGQGADHWAISEVNLDTTNASFRQFVTMFPPRANRTNGGKYEYYPDPSVENRVYDQSTITVALTANLAAITFSASMAGQLSDGDAIGLRSSATGLPTQWYRVYGFNGTTGASIAPAYQGTTAAAATFVVSACPYLEWRRPGLIQSAPSTYALYRIVESESGVQAAEGYRQAWEREIQRIADVAGHWGQKKLTQPAIRSSFPNISRRPV